MLLLLRLLAEDTGTLFEAVADMGPPLPFPFALKALLDNEEEGLGKDPPPLPPPFPPDEVEGFPEERIAEIEYGSMARAPGW